MSCRRAAPVPEVIVIGVDGMDPAFVERHWDALPNLAGLKQDGSFQRLRTTWPPQSPVAWSTFLTGASPEEHGIFDFVHRDPATLQPYSSMSRTEPPRFVLPLGPYRVPLTSAHVRSLRRGIPFWKALSDRGIPVTVMRMPTNYPPYPAGRAIAGMGVPDLAGTQGTFTFFTTDVGEISRDVPGGRFVHIEMDRGHANLRLPGPPNSLLAKQPESEATLELDVDPKEPVARIQIGEEAVILKQGEWSDWIPVRFPLIAGLAAASGMLRVYAKQLQPDVEVYVSPINVDPEDPALPLSAPSSFSRRVARHTGRFFTLGIPEDTAAPRDGAMTLTEFRRQAQLVFADERRLLLYSLDHFSGGLLFYYFSVVDQSSHMLWGRHEPELLEMYRAVDECIGEARHRHPHAELIVMSDHGFTSFDRAVHLNAWLQHRGFLSIAGAPRADSTLADIDWRQTDAYALGLNGLYLNLQGREAHGTVQRGRQCAALAATLTEQLLAWRDPDNGRRVVSSVSPVHAAAANANTAPDLIVGYAPGYRASWQTGVGGSGPAEIENNRDAWIGDHCIDPSAVPGVLFTLHLPPPQNPSLQNLSRAILARFEARKAGASKYPHVR